MQNDDCVEEISSDVPSCRANGEALSRKPSTLPLPRRGESQACFSKVGKVRKARAQVASPKRVSFCDKVKVREYPGSWVRVCHGFRMERRLDDITPIFLSLSTN